jgi:hypothetical protein
VTIAVDGARLQADAPNVDHLPARLIGTLAERVFRELLHHIAPDCTMSVPLSALEGALGTSRRQIRRSTTALLRAGVLELDRPAQAGGRYTPKVYRLAARTGHSATAQAGVLSPHVADGVTPRRLSVM